MKNDLAESILKSIMSDWQLDRLKDELTDIQTISEIKYDDYQQYTHGMRYVESLALWLRQFDKPQERECMYNFIKDNLIFISEEEMRQLIEYSYPIIMKHYIMNRTKEYCNRERIFDKEKRRQIYSLVRRKSLFLGLSDGAHIDFFRRQNPGLSNEQVFVHYDFSDDKAKEMLDELRQELGQEMGFDKFFLVDDFSGSGYSYIRKDTEGWHGKIHKFYKRLCEVGYHVKGIDIHLVLYLSTAKSLEYMRKKVMEYFADKEVSITIDAIQLVNPYDMDQNVNLKRILAENYNKMKATGKKSFVDKHFEIGRGKEPYLGFSDCSLPLVIYHNTPNNSFPVLWYSWEDEVNPLFPRVTRHKESLV